MESHRVRVLVLACCFGLACCTFLHAQVVTPPPATVASGFLSGRAIDELGRPVKGAAVGVFRNGTPLDTAALLAAPRATTDADGQYRISAPAEYLQVVVAAPGRQACVTLARAAASTVRFLPAALLLPGVSLTGRVRDAAGGALPGASILVHDAAPSFGTPEQPFAARPFAARVVADAKGCFVVPGAPSTSLRVDVTLPGYFQLSRFVAHGSPLDVTLEPSGFVHGRVVDTHGAPLEGISMGAFWAEPNRDPDRPLSDAEGRFSVTVPHKGRFRIAGAETAFPHRSFRSKLLHGPTDDVVVAQVTWPMPPHKIVTVQCVDVRTKAAIPRFHASRQQDLAEQAQWAMFHHFDYRRECRDTFSFQADNQAANRDFVVVDAAGHGFEIVAVPGDLTTPLVIALGPESFLTGRVIDEETNEPVVGAAVLALPNGPARGGADALRMTVPTDATGRYRIGGLRPGDYGVQVFGVDRPASAVARVHVDTAAEATLDLILPRRRWVEVTLLGTMPAATPSQLSFRTTHLGQEGFGNPSVATALRDVGSERTLEVGPFDNGIIAVGLWRPSRARPGEGTWFDLGTIDPDKGRVEIALPELANVVVRGRIRLPGDVPTARIAVLAHRVVKGERSFEEPEVAGLEADGQFALDLLAGTWLMQLVDVETGIVFHTDAEHHEVVAGGMPIEIEPELHWLEPTFVAATPDAEVVLHEIQVDVPPPRRGGWAYLERFGHAGMPHNNWQVRLPWRAGATRQRWLVPRGRIDIVAYQELDPLLAQGLSSHIVASARVDITEPVHGVELRIRDAAELPHKPAK